MDCPQGCPPRVYELMKQCWLWSAGDRPTFCQIHHALETMFQETSITEGKNLRNEIRTDFSSVLRPIMLRPKIL